MTTDDHAKAKVEEPFQEVLDHFDQLSSSILTQLQEQLGDDGVPDDANIPAISLSIVTLVQFVKSLVAAEDFTVAITTADDLAIPYTLHVTHGNVGLTGWTRPDIALPDPYQVVVVWHAVGDVLLERRVAHLCPDDEATVDAPDGLWDCGLWRLHGDPSRVYVPGSHILYWIPLPGDPPEIGVRMNPETGNLLIRQRPSTEG